jgi:hypothetical protein
MTRKHRALQNSDEAVTDDEYFSRLTNAAIEASSTTYPYTGYVTNQDVTFVEDDAEYVAIEIRRMRKELQPTGAYLKDEKKMFLKYRNSLRSLSAFMAAEGLGRTSFRRSLNTELGIVDRAVNALSSLGSKRTAKNDPYNRAGHMLAALLSSFGLPYANGEAAKFLWFCGWRDPARAGNVEVIDPFKIRSAEVAKDSRDPLENEARKRWHTKRKSTGRRDNWGLSLVRMMRAQVKHRE